MAITRYDYRFWKELRAENELPWFPFVLELGQANWYGDLHPDCLVTDVRELVCGANVGPLLARLREPGTPEEPLAFIQAEVFYRALLRPNAMDAVDLHGTPRATIADLNLPQPLVGYSVVINTGTGEHVYDQSQFFRTCHTACTVAGLMVHMMPCWGWLDHGFYNYHPTFVADLAAVNGYQIVKWWLYDLAADRCAVITRPADIHAYASEFGVTGSTMHAVCFRKTTDAPFGIPMQGYYAGTLDASLRAAWQSERDWNRGGT